MGQCESRDISSDAELSKKVAGSAVGAEISDPYSCYSLGMLPADTRCNTLMASDGTTEWRPEGLYNDVECKCDSKNNISVAGLRYVKCKKYQYLGTQNDCCLGKKDSKYPLVTCDPKFTNTASPCQDTLKEYCSQGNITSDPICKKWINDNSANSANLPFINSVMSTYCSDPDKMKGDTECRKWVLQFQGANDGIMQEKFCAKYPEDPLCACISSPLKTCPLIDKNCRATGYQTKAMITTNCQNIDCKQILNMSPEQKAVIKDNLITQNCSISNVSAQVPADAGGDASMLPGADAGADAGAGAGGQTNNNMQEEEEEKPKQSFFEQNMWVIIGAGIFLFIIIIGIILLVVMSGGSKKNNMMMQPGEFSQYNYMPPQMTGMPPQPSGFSQYNSMSPQMSGMPPQMSGMPPQMSGMPPQMGMQSYGYQGNPSPYVMGRCDSSIGYCDMFD